MSRIVTDLSELTPEELELVTKYPHYYKDVRHLRLIDPYRVMRLYEVTDQAIGHTLKKVLVPGGRKKNNMRQDIVEARDTLNRWLILNDEDAAHAPRIQVPIDVRR